MSESDHLGKVLHKLENCANYNSVFAMEHDFNEIGLTLQTTSQNWMLLCRIEDEKPVTASVTEDFIFLAPVGHMSEEVSERALGIIKSFVQTNGGDPAEVKIGKRVWQNGVRVYDRAISIMHEDINRLAQTLID